MTVQTYDNRPCTLGEGPLWHPKRQQFFWFDILSNRLMTREADGPHHWEFTENVSAAGWIDHDTLLIASETQLMQFDLTSGAHHPICPLESDILHTRSNDGRADPQGGFWIGTMGKNTEKKAGAIYRYYRGELRQLYPDITIPNAICFAPDGSRAYFADTATSQIMTVTLDDLGWPNAEPCLHIDLSADGLHPDGAVVDAAGNLWNAQWGAARVAQYSPQGALLQTIAFPARHTSCPGFGGADLTTLFCTTARQGIPPSILATHPENGQTFAVQTTTTGQAESRVLL